MCRELRLRDIPFLAQVQLPVVYKGVETGGTYRIDLVVAGDSRGRTEGRGTTAQRPRSPTLKLTGKRVGLVINFNVPVSTPRPMSFDFLRVSVSPWWVFFVGRANA